MKKLLELVTNPATNKLSASDCALVGAFVVSSWALIYHCLFYPLNELLLATYLAAWVTQSQASKHAAIKRDSTINNKAREQDNGSN